MSASAVAQRWAASDRPRILFVAHSSGGGIGRHLESLAVLVGDAAQILLLQPVGRGYLRLGPIASDGESLHFDQTEDWGALVRLLEQLGVDRVHLHHVDGLPPGVLDLAATLGCPLDLTLHDFYPACPAWHLVGGDGRFCGAPSDCHRCTEARPAQWFDDIDAWRTAFGRLLRTGARVIAPSQSTADLFRRFFAGVPVHVWPHAERASSVPRVARVAVPGAISRPKGLDLLEACVADAEARSLPLHFRVLGYVARPLAAHTDRLSIAGEFSGPLESLLAREAADVAFFPAQCPETFSYTLSAAMAARLPVVATNLGAFPERLEGYAHSRLVAWDASPAAFNDALLELAGAATALPTAPDEEALRSYRERYLEGLERGPRRAASVVEIPDRWLQAPPAAAKDWSFPALFEDAIDCGRGTSLAILRERMPVAQQEHDWAQLARADIDRLHARHHDTLARLGEREQRIREQAEQLGETRKRLEYVDRELHRTLSSRSWRITAPLRAAMRWLARLRGR